MHPSARKERGAYYTDPTIASFLSRWAIRSSEDRVLEPCFGGGVFLEAAVHRLSTLGGLPASRITGVEADRAAHASTRDALQENGGLPKLICEDFFRLDSTGLGKFDAVVGNPPFIRYQRFTGSVRDRALEQASKAGVRLSALTSAWAPFVAHSTSFLENDGRLAMVIPAELCHATYARPLLQLLARRFRSVSLLTFARKLFPELSEDTVLLLADGYGASGGELRMVALPDASALPAGQDFQLEGTPIRQGVVERDVARLITYLLPPRVRELYESLAGDLRVARLGSLADVGIGYVTGDNRFFHFNAAETRRQRIPSRFLAPAVRHGAWLGGLEFTQRDWHNLRQAGHEVYLLHIPRATRVLPRSIQNHLKSGHDSGVHKAYKCRVRNPWYSVPHVAVPDLFLTYMSNVRPAFAVNRARAVATNTLLCIRLRPLSMTTAEMIAVASCTSLTALSAEIEGHSLGGGMLKMEPGEAARLLLGIPASLRRPAHCRSLLKRLNTLLRHGAIDDALDLGDLEILQRGIGLSSSDCINLRQASNLLRERRRSR